MRWHVYWMAWASVVLASLAQAQQRSPVSYTASGTGSRTPVTATQAVPVEEPTGTPNLYEIRVGKTARMTMKIYDTDSDVLVPLQSFCTLIEVVCQAAGMALGGHVQIQGRTLVVDQRSIFVRNDTTYISIHTLSQFLHVTPIIDRDDASVTLLNADRLPVMRAAARARTHEFLMDAARQTANPPADIVQPAASDEWGGLTIDYTFLSQGTLDHSLPTYLVSASTALAGGALLARTSGGNGQQRHGDVSWLGVWSHNRAVTQLRLGEGDAGGLGTIRVRGLTIGNVPYLRPSHLDVVDFDGTLPPDWSIEAYRSGALIAFDSVGSSGQYSLQVPIEYGTNPYTLVAYGPAGQTRTFTRLFRALPSLLPAHALEYQSSMGWCVQRNCSWMMNSDIHYGLTPYWTLRGGATEYFFHDAPTTFHPYVALTGAPRGPFSLNIEAVSALYDRMGMYFDPSSTASLSVEYAHYAADYAARTLVAGGQRSTASLTGRLYTPSGRTGVELLGVRIADTLGSHVLLRGGAVFAFNGATIRPYVRETADLGVHQTFLGTSAVVSGAALHLWSRSPWWTRWTAEMHRGRVSQWEAIVSQGGVGRFQVNGGVRWQQTLPGMQLVLSVTTNMSALRSSTQLTTVSTRSAPQVIQTLSGSAYWDPSVHQVVASSDGLLGRAGVSGVVFFDRNGNGRRDPGEETIPSVTVRLGAAAVKTDQSGRYQLWGVAPTTYVQVAIDTATLPSPWWAPVFNTAAVQTLPNRVVSLDIPVVETGGAEGAIVANGAAIRGPVVLTNVLTGRRIRVTPFSDGTFYQVGLLPGPYVATVRRSQEAAVGGQPGTVEAGTDGARLKTAAGPSGMGTAEFEVRARTITRHVTIVVQSVRRVNQPPQAEPK